MTTTDPTPLQESIARVLHEIDPISEHGHDWRKLSDAERKFYIRKAAAVLPIIRAAQADVLRQAAEDVTEIDGHRDDSAANWLRACATDIEKETPDGQ